MAPDKSTDTEWELYGASDPYFGVLADGKFRRANLTEDGRAEFFASGEEHLREIMAFVRAHVDPAFRPTRALDFGCGVGRVLIPMAREAEQAVGVDVSPSMLAEARANCAARGIGNVELVPSDDELSRVTGEFDFIHSIIVFQHIPADRGAAIFGRLMDRLRPGGVGVAHFTYAKTYRPRRLLPWIKRRVPLARAAADLLRRGGVRSPEMRMIDYDLNTLFAIVQRGGADRVHARLTDHGGNLGAVLFFKKKRS